MDKATTQHTASSSPVSGEALLLFIVLLLGLVLRLWGLDARSLWLDEHTSLTIASKPLSLIVSGESFDFHTPPGYYILLHFWLSLVPATEWGLRLFSLSLDLLNVLLIGRLAGRLFTRREGVIAALLYAVSPYAVYYGQEGRMYSLLAFEVLASAVLCVQYVKTPRLRELLMLVPIGVLGCYTHYFYLLALASLGLAVMVLIRTERKALFGFLSAGLTIGLCFLPWLGVVAGLAASGGQGFRKFVIAVLPYTLFRFGAGYGNMPLVAGAKESLPASVIAHLPLVIVYMLVFGGAALYALGVLLRHSKDRAIFLLLPLLLPPLIALVVSFKAPMLSERYLIVSFPFFIILISLLATYRSITAKAFTYAIFALTFFGTAQHHLNPAFGNADWRSAAALIATKNPKVEGPIIVIPDYTAGVLSYYLKDSPYRIVAIRPSLKEQELAAAASAGIPGFWLVQSMADPSAREFLEGKGFQLAMQQEFPFENGLVVSLFTAPAR